MIAYLSQYARWHSLIGIGVSLLSAWYFSHDRSKISYRTIAAGIFLQGVLGFCMISTSWGHALMHALSSGIVQLYEAADAGIIFVFGDLARATGAAGFVFAIKVLPMIVFFGALMNILFYWGIIPACVRLINKVIRPFLGTTGSETACVIGNSVLGQTEAPLLVRPYLASMSESEIFLVMVSGMGTLSAAIIAVYAAMGVPVMHLLTSSIMAIPATLIIAKLMQPEDVKKQAENHIVIQDTVLSSQQSLLEAIGQGTMDGLHLAAAIGAILISYIGLMALIDMILLGISSYMQLLMQWLQIPFTVPSLSLAWFLELLGRPAMWLLGLQGMDAEIGAALWGIRIATNEMLAYSQLVISAVSPRALALLTYALCGFANISSIGIQINGIGLLAPSQKPVLMRLGVRAMCAAVLSNLLTACVVALLLT